MPSLSGPGVDLLEVFLDGLLRCDVGHALAMLVSPLVVLFHPLDPFRVRVVEALQTYRFGIASTEFLVRAQASEQAAHELRKTEALSRPELPPASSFTPSPDMEFVCEICWRDGQSKD